MLFVCEKYFGPDRSSRFAHLRNLIASIILINSGLAYANPMQINVVGLFSDQAVIQVNGQQHLLKVGQSSPEGVKLIAANSNKAVLMFEGKRQTYHLGDQINADYGPGPKQATVTLWPNKGMYKTAGSINGYSVDFLVDTGASAVAMNAETANRLGIDYQKGRQVGVRTASGRGLAYKVTLDSVQVGDISLNNIDAVVMNGSEPSSVLLGMTFLGQLDIQHDGNRLELKQKY